MDHKCNNIFGSLLFLCAIAAVVPCAESSFLHLPLPIIPGLQANPSQHGFMVQPYAPRFKHFCSLTSSSTCTGRVAFVAFEATLLTMIKIEIRDMKQHFMA